MSLSRQAAAIVLLIGLGSPADAADPVPASGPETSECGKPLTFTKATADAIAAAGGFQGSATSARSNQFLIATGPSPELGSMVFANDGGWKGYSIETGGVIQAVRLSGDERRVMIFSMLSTGDPGQGFTVMTTGDGFHTMACTYLAFPDELNKPSWRGEFMTFSGFNAEENGQGVLIGSAEVGEAPNTKTKWYSYQTKSFGAQWTGPFPADSQESPLQGYLRKLPRNRSDRSDQIATGFCGAVR